MLKNRVKNASLSAMSDNHNNRGNDEYPLGFNVTNAMYPVRRTVCAPGGMSSVLAGPKERPMTRHNSVARLTLALLAVLALAGPAAAERQGKQVPFRGQFEGVSTVIAFDPPIGTAITSGTGNATHLGQFSFQHPHTVNFETSQLAGTFDLVAANGDKIFADISGQISPTSTPGIVLVVGTATVTGGTGRFAGASGSFAIQRLFDPATFISVGSFEGTISSPGASKR